MKDFFKMFFASCLGIMVGLVLLVVIISGIAGVMASSNDGLSTDGLLTLDFKEQFLEKTGNVETNILDQNVKESIGLRDFDKIIQKAKEDSAIKGILIKSPEIMMGQATLLSVMNSLKDFKESGKFIYAYADYYTQGSYFISSVADSIFLNPNGMVDAKGYSTMIPFFKGSLDKLGVKFDIFYAGDFKSATEPFRRTDMSENNKIQTRQFLGEMLEVMIDEVSKNRGMQPSDFDEIFNDYSGRTAPLAMQSGLVDDLRYWNEVESMLKDKVGVAADKKLKLTSFATYRGHQKLTESGPSSKKIAVVYAEGNVGYGAHTKGSITDGEYIKIFSKIRRDDKVKAIVLRVNSGGGSALTSDIIWDEIEKCKAIGLPVIASFGDYAASGGYYIAAGADTIVAAPNTLTGSIGVFSMLPNAREFLTDKLGMTFDTVQTHDMAVGYNGVFELSDKEKQYFTESTNMIYDTFLTRVADGREMTKEAVHEIAQGRVWTGLKGKEIGLVDVIGDLSDAIDIAASKAGLDEYKIYEYPHIEVDFLEQMIKELSKGMNKNEDVLIKLSKQNRKLLKLYDQHKDILEAEGVQARLPFVLEY